MNAASPAYNQPSATDASVAGARAWFAQQGLVRSREHRVLGGVTAPFARRFGLNRLVARLFTLIAVLMTTPVPYLVLWFLMPREEAAPAEEVRS
jgi:phage shock protein C